MNAYLTYDEEDKTYYCGVDTDQDDVSCIMTGGVFRIRRMILTALLFVMLSAVLLPLKTKAETITPVRVGYYENEVFEEGAREGAVKTGYAYEYYQKMSEYTGWRYEYVYGDFSDLYRMLIEGEIDLLAGLAWKEDRESLIGYPESPMGNETYNLVKHDADEDITTDPQTLNGRKIGVLDSAMKDALYEYLENNTINANVVVFPDYEPLFTAFDNREIDVIAAEGDGAYGRDNSEHLYSFGASNYYLCVSKSRPELLNVLNAAQAELSLDEPNYINFLRSKYYPVSISSRAFSTAEKEWLSAHNRLVVGYLNNYLPYSDTDTSGGVTGVVRDIVPRMLEDLDIKGLEVSYQSFDSYDEMIAALNSGEVDVSFPAGGGLYYSEEGGVLLSNAVVSAATEIVYEGEYDENTLRVFAVNENNRMQYYFIKSHYPDAEIIFFSSIDECLRAVGEGTVGCTTLNGLRANDILRNSRYSDLSLLQTAYNDDRCFGV